MRRSHHSVHVQHAPQAGDDNNNTDCFFESFDRVPSGISFHLHLPSSSSDSDFDDSRVSFASALPPPSATHHTSSDEDENNHAYDYDIWMSEPTSVHDRRRRLLQGFTSQKDIAGASPTTLKHSLSRLSLRTTSPSPPHPPPHALPPLPSVSLTRSRSEMQLVPVPDHPTTFRRAMSAPAALHCLQSQRVGGEPPMQSDSLCRIKNLDTGKEFLVTELTRVNDVQTGLQLTLEEFERFLGHSPVVEELMRRVKLGGGDEKKRESSVKVSAPGGSRRRKGGGWLKNIKFVASSMTGLISDKDREGGLGRSSGRMKVRHHGKSHKELTGLYMCQQINAHHGSIWCIKFSSDSLYLASAGEDRVVHVWQVIESSSVMQQDSRSSLPPLPRANGGTLPSKGTSKTKISTGGRKSSVPDYVVMPETVFSFSEKPVCSFEGHLDDVLDLSWSKSQYLLSSSMDKTVRLWGMESKACLKLFAHNDFVTCIQFNPVDDRYFISGSLVAKVRIWSIPDRQVVDWTDLHEMVTAVCYTPDGQGALVGSHKGTCRFYNTSDCKLNQESQLDVWSKKRKSHAKKITGFQFVPGNPSEVLITSADSRIRVFTGGRMIHKFRGFRNTSSQISASFTMDGKYVLSASEDSYVYLWKRNTPRSVSVGGKSKGFITTSSHEHFYCKDVSVAIPWPNAGSNCTPPPYLPSSSGRSDRIDHDDAFPSGRSHCPSLPEQDISPSSQDALRYRYRSGSAIGNSNGSLSSSQRSDATISSASVSASSSSSNSSRGWYRGGSSRTNNNSAPEASNAWGLVVVTAGMGGEIKIYQNFGLPLRLSRQNNLLF